MERDTDAVIPDRNVVYLPPVPHVKIVVLRDLGKEEREDRVRLCLGNAYYSPREACPPQQAGERSENKVQFMRGDRVGH